MAKIKIHFVCLGNAYRSRIAEAYMKSLNLPDFSFSSSGLAAGFHIQPLPKHTSFVVTKHGLNQFLSKGQVQTTSDLLKKQDLIIFMHHDLYRDAIQAYGLDPQKCLYWDVADLWQALLRYGDKGQTWTLGSVLAEETFQKIKQRCDMLTRYITKTIWVGVVDAQNNQLDLRLPIEWINKRGLWTRSIRVIIMTGDGRYVVEKRSSRVIFARNMLDLSMAGYVDAGEEPLEAAVREIKEELGISITSDQLKLLQVTKGSYYHPSYKRHTRGFTYNYFVRLKGAEPQFIAQESEVAKIILLTPAQTKRLVKRHYLRHFGKLNYLYRLYAKNLKLAQELNQSS
jgi:isopentenyl-diphosphate Delta-isomerase